MIDSFVKLIDYLIKLAEDRDKRNDRLFESYIQPLYDESQKVYTDFLQVLQQLKELANNNADYKLMIHLLREARTKHLAVRMKLRELIKLQSDANTRGLFEQGILGVLEGAFSESAHTLMSLVDQLEEGHEYEKALVREKDQHPLEMHEHLKNRREIFSIQVDQQITAINDAWKDVVTAYAHEQLVHAGKAKAIDKPIRKGRRTY